MKIFLAIFFLIFSSVGKTNPIIFKCDSEGRMTDSLTPSEMALKMKKLLEDLSKLGPDARESKIQEYCQGAVLCSNELRSILTLSYSSGRIVEDYFKQAFEDVINKSLHRKKEMEGIVSFPEGIFKAAVEYDNLLLNMSFAQECRVALVKENPDHFVLPDGRSCMMMNFNHSPYMYASGIRYAHENSPGNLLHGPPTCEGILTVVASAIAVDQDPYAALAVSLMENGPQVERLYLDPIGVVKTLGCKSSGATSSKNNLNSFSTYYNVEYGEVSNPRLETQLDQLVSLAKEEKRPGVSYLCGGQTHKIVKDKVTGGEVYAFDERLRNDCRPGQKYTALCDRPIQNSCCLKLGYKVKDGLFLEYALTLSSLNHYIDTPLHHSIRGTDPSEYSARRLQRFNGYTDSMGGAEAVSAWRSGVDYYKTPAYGYQAMDFLLNTILPNGYIRTTVEKIETFLGKKSPSVLCKDLKAGVYHVDHDYFFKKHGSSPRMTAILSRWGKNPRWGALSQRDKKVMIGEVRAICFKEPDFCKDIHAFDAKEFLEKLSHPSPESEILLTKMMNTYIREYYPRRKTVALANGMDQGFNWKPMSDEQSDLFLKAFHQNIIAPMSTTLSPIENPEKIKH